MFIFRQFCMSGLLIGGVMFTIPRGVHAETYHSCAGFIETVPAVISTQGVWCLRKDLSTNITSGNAITIAANNVTIDCNDFKLGGLAAGTSSTASGVYSDKLNSTVRHCNIRGFFVGIDFVTGGAGQLVEDNRLDNNLRIGIMVSGDNNRVRRNAVYDTGGYPSTISSIGIDAFADVTDNTVAGVFATTPSTDPYGIEISGDGNQASGNRVRGLVVAGGGSGTGISVTGVAIRVDGNHVSANSTTSGTGIEGNTGADTFCSNNTVANFSTPITQCRDSGGNDSY